MGFSAISGGAKPFFTKPNNSPPPNPAQNDAATASRRPIHAQNDTSNSTTQIEQAKMAAAELENPESEEMEDVPTAEEETNGINSIDSTHFLYGVYQKEIESIYEIITHIGPQDPYYEDMFKGANKSKKTFSLTEIHLQYPKIPGDIPQQIRFLRTAIHQEPAGIAITLPKIEPFIAELRVAREKQVNVTLLNSHVEEYPALAELGFPAIAIDDKLAGEKLSSHMLEFFSKGAILILDHAPLHLNKEHRIQGLLRPLRKFQIKAFRKTIIPGEDTFKISQVVQSIPEAIQAIILLDQVALQPLLDELADLKLHYPTLQFIGAFGKSYGVMQALESGILNSTVDVCSELKGFLCVRNDRKSYRLKPELIISN